MTTPKTTARRQLRSLAMQVLAHCDAQGVQAAGDVEDFVRRATLAPEDADFVRLRVQRVIANWADIDRNIAAAAENWELGRLAAPDRAVLRLAVGEMLYVRYTPAKVVIDEAIELAKIYGSAQSPRFVNGVLDAIYRKHGAPESQPRQDA
jgi:N utilization substance protein B